MPPGPCATNLSATMSQPRPCLPLPPHSTPGAGLVVLFGLVLLGAFVGQAVGAWLLGAVPAAGGEGAALLPRGPWLLLQAVVAGSAFIAAPWLYLSLFARQGLGGYFQWRRGYVLVGLLTVGLVVACMVVNTWCVHWSLGLRWPAWVQEREVALQRVMVWLTAFGTWAELGVGLVVMGVLPAVGEELLFRGLVQPLFHRLVGNVHWAVICSAFAFSAMHLQCYGFVPRFLLGCVFGYVYWWTGDLFFPMLGHFFHNALMLLLCFLRQQQGVALVAEVPEGVLPWPVLVLAIVVGGVLGRCLWQLAGKGG